MPKTDTVSVWAGTRKGAFVFRSSNRKTWRMEGPFFRGWEVNHVAQDPREPARYYAAINSAWFGAHIHASTDGGKTFQLSEAGLEMKCLPETSLKRVWHVEPGAADEPGAVYAGGDPGVLFKSEDWGQNWSEVASLTAHPTRDKWTPGAGGMCLHSIQCLGGGRMIAAISAAGAFRTVDGGATWEPFNAGVRADFQPVKFPEVGQCVHKLLAHPSNPEALYQQNHCGIYKAKFGAKKWTDISKGLPSRFGFGLAVPGRRTGNHVHGADRRGRIPLRAGGEVPRGAQPGRRQKLDVADARAAAAQCAPAGAARIDGGRPALSRRYLRGHDQRTGLPHGGRRQQLEDSGGESAAGDFGERGELKAPKTVTVLRFCKASLLFSARRGSKP